MPQLWQNVGCFHLSIWYNRNRIWSKIICRKSTVSWDYVSEKHVGFVWNIETWGLRFFAALLEYHNLNFGSLIPYAGMEVTYNSPNRCRIAAKLWHFQSFAEWSRCSFPLPNWDLTNLAPGVPLPPSHHDFQLPEDVFHTKTNKLIPTNHMATSQLMAFNFLSFPTWKIVGACDCTRVGQLRISPEKAPLRDFSCGLKWLFRWKSCKSKEKGEMTELDLKFQWASQIRSQIRGILKPITQWQTKEGITWINPINPAAQFCTLCQFFQDFFPASVLSLCRISSSVVWRFCQNTSDGSDRTTSTCPGIGNVKGNVKGVCKGD